MRAAATAALGLLAVLGEAVVPVLVVDAAGGGVGEGVVGVGYGDEFGFGGVVAATGGRVSQNWVWVELD